MRILAAMLGLICVAGTAVAAATYRWVDADGLHYSDQPHPGAELITLGESQSYSANPATPVAVPAGRKARSREPAGFRYDSCAVVQPAADQVLFEVAAVTVAVQLRPAKRSGDRVVLSFDGTPMEPADSGQVEFRITPIERGTHVVAATVRDESGRNLCQSAAVSFHVRQPSVLTPLHPGKGH